ncbi:MAG: type II restriction endonuclease, partial [Candidatus Accumulibacter sp.]|nr:type II restriction endonuclease [Accumulibacter sp.]
DRLIAEDANSEKLLKPFLEGKDLKKWRVESRDLWLIYIPKNSIDIDDYPAIKAHLLPFREKLEKRATRQKWFELQQAQG